jgi:hypothetical protein
MSEISDTKAAKQHRELFARVEKAQAKLRELRAAHDQAVEQDRQQEAEYAQGRRTKLPSAAGPEAEADVAQAVRELELLERELPRSADAVWIEAYPHLEQAQKQLERQLEEEDLRVEETIGEALRLLDDRAELGRQFAWIERALWESSIHPFDGRTRPVSSSPAAAELRRSLAALRHQLTEAARRRRERAIELVMMFNPDRSPRLNDGRPLAVRRAEAEQIVKAREAAR